MSVVRRTDRNMGSYPVPWDVETNWLGSLTHVSEVLPSGWLNMCKPGPSRGISTGNQNHCAEPCTEHSWRGVPHLVTAVLMCVPSHTACESIIVLSFFVVYLVEGQHMSDTLRGVPYFHSSVSCVSGVSVNSWQLCCQESQGPEPEIR